MHVFILGIQDQKKSSFISFKLVSIKHLVTMENLIKTFNLAIFASSSSQSLSIASYFLSGHLFILIISSRLLLTSSIYYILSLNKIIKYIMLNKCMISVQYLG